MSEPLRSRRPDGFEIDTSTERLDLAQVHGWLSTEAHWVLGRSVEGVTRSAQNSLCFGVYAPDGTQVGSARGCSVSLPTR